MYSREKPYPGGLYTVDRKIYLKKKHIGINNESPTNVMALRHTGNIRTHDGSHTGDKPYCFKLSDFRFSIHI